VIGVNALFSPEWAELFDEELNGYDGEEVGDVRDVGDAEDEVVLAVGDGLALLLRQLQVLLLDLLHLPLVLLLNLLLAVSDYYHVCVSRMHLVESVHHHREGVVTQNEKNYCCLLLLITLNQSNGTVLHLAGAHRFSVDVV
jgi:hypothetical protein